MNKPTYEKWGNNNYHNPSFCEDCEEDCRFCSNGPRGPEYRRAQIEYSMQNDFIEEAREYERENQL